MCWEKVITVHPTFWRLVQKTKFSHQKYFVLYIGETVAQTLRVISFKKDTYFLHRRSPTKVTLVSKCHIFLQYKWFKINVIYENNFDSKNVTEYHSLRFKSIERFNAIGLAVNATQ